MSTDQVTEIIAAKRRLAFESRKNSAAVYLELVLKRNKEMNLEQRAVEALMSPETAKQEQRYRRLAAMCMYGDGDAILYDTRLPGEDKGKLTNLSAEEFDALARRDEPVHGKFVKSEAYVGDQDALLHVMCTEPQLHEFPFVGALTTYEAHQTRFGYQWFVRLDCRNNPEFWLSFSVGMSSQHDRVRGLPCPVTRVEFIGGRCAFSGTPSKPMPCKYKIALLDVTLDANPPAHRRQPQTENEILQDTVKECLVKAPWQIKLRVTCEAHDEFLIVGTFEPQYNAE